MVFIPTHFAATWNQSHDSTLSGTLANNEIRPFLYSSATAVVLALLNTCLSMQQNESQVRWVKYPVDEKTDDERLNLK